MGISKDSCTHPITELIDIFSRDRRCELCGEVIRRPPHVPSPCCNANTSAALSDGIVVGSCEKCGTQVSRINYKTNRVEWLDGESPYTEKKLRLIKEWYPPNTFKTVIGLVGENGAGKGTFAKILSELLNGKKTVERFSSGSFLLELLLAGGQKSPLRKDMQNFAAKLREKFGPSVITDYVGKQLINSAADVVIFDGVRWETDAKLIRRFPRHVLLYVTADIEIRYRRLKDRKEKAGEGEMTWKQFMEEEQAETEIEIPKIVERADLVIVNNFDLDDFKSRVKDFFGSFPWPGE